jgi:hypothetical protein
MPYYGPKLITDNLTLLLDAGNYKSYISGSLQLLDLSGYDNTASFVSGSFYTSSFRGGIAFNGSSSRMEISSSDSLNPSGSMTLGAFVYVNGYSSSFGPIFFKVNNYTSSNYEQYSLYIATGSNTSSSFGITVSGADRVQRIVTSSFSYEKYAYVCATINTASAAINLYLNGTLVNSSSSGPSALDPSSYSLKIGGVELYSGAFLNGTIYSVHTYNRALTDADILQNYYAIQSRFPTNYEGDFTETNYLVVAGGGGGGSSLNNSAGGGGAGGLLSGSLTLHKGETYTVTIGSGGTTVLNSTGSNGSNSVLFGNDITTVTAIGGGGGGIQFVSGSGGTESVGSSGGSGGGAAYYTLITGSLGGTGTVGQGNQGGASLAGAEANAAGGGGAGGNADSIISLYNNTSPGGIGAISNITGTSTYYAGGGGGGIYSVLGETGSIGGLGGGGQGGTNGSGSAGSANTGGGGGGAASGSLGGVGGSGVVILSMDRRGWRTDISSTGNPSVAFANNRTIYTFTTSGTITI